MSGIFSVWGLPSHVENPECHWGARAIFTNQFIDILYDRQSMVGSSEPEKEKLANWLNKTGLPKFRKLVEKEKLYTDENRLVRFEQDGYYIEGNPNRSYGYLYIGAGPIKENPNV